jgi:hypothetical protein
MPFCHLT